MDKNLPPVIYYSDELSDEFSTAQITPIKIDANYDYGNNSFGNLFWFPAGMSVLKVSLLSIMVPFVMVAWDGVFATIIRHLMPARWFSKDRKRFQVSKVECKIYEALGIKHWKDNVLELGMFTSFSKKKVSDPNNPEYVERFILNAIMAVRFIFGTLSLVLW